jgi:hypothetical protein
MLTKATNSGFFLLFQQHSHRKGPKSAQNSRDSPVHDTETGTHTARATKAASSTWRAKPVCFDMAGDVPITFSGGQNSAGESKEISIQSGASSNGEAP